MIAVAYGAIAALVLTALRRGRQLRSNRLGLATGLIFLSCSAGHAAHAVGYLSPLIARVSPSASDVALLLFQCTIGQVDGATGAAISRGEVPSSGVLGAGWATAGLDAVTAVVAVYYLTLRRHYRKLLDPVGPTLFADLEERRRTEQLDEQRVRALDAARQKSHFLAAMSHEIRTPLNGVLGMAELLTATDLTDRQQRYVRTLAESGTRLMTIVDEVLDLSRIEGGHVELHPADLRLREVLDGIVRLYGQRAADRGVELSVSVDDAVPEVLHGDAARLRQVVMNLVSNAIKSTEDGAVAVEVARTPAADDLIGLEVTVCDTGIGIEPDALEALFEPFVQADASISGSYGGSGLGLAICRQLVRLMGGDIAVDSSPGAGTAFSFTIALPPGAPGGADADGAQAPTAEAEAGTVTEAEAGTPGQPSGRARVLVVDGSVRAPTPRTCR